AEMEQKGPGCAIKSLPAYHVLASRRNNEFSFHERVDHAATVHDASLNDLGKGDRLAVRDHGQRLQGGLREPHGRLEPFDKFAQHLMVLRLGGKLVSAGDRADVDAMLRALKSSN